MRRPKRLRWFRVPSITNKKHDMKHALSRRTLLSVGAQALGVATLGSSFATLASAQATAATITRTDLGYASLLQGAGCNVLTVPGGAEDGCLLIDGGLAVHSDTLIQAALTATKQGRIHTLINTHYHPEQTGSNEAVGAQGGIIIAHEQTKMCLQNSVLSTTFDGRYGPLADAGIPTQALRGDGTMKFAGQEIIYGYLPAAHTNGDIFLYFPILDTLFTGGAVSTDSWPLLDIKQGAWMGGLVEGYEKLARVVSADTVVIPAHGPVTNGATIIRMRNMYSELHLTLSELLNVGMGWDDVVAMNPLKQYEEKYGDASRFLELAQRSIQMAYVPD
jgi:glyoxylase-like metal-dependent hydrolase (beta-lactamase superfamily II)